MRYNCFPVHELAMSIASCSKYGTDKSYSYHHMDTDSVNRIYTESYLLFWIWSKYYLFETINILINIEWIEKKNSFIVC